MVFHIVDYVLASTMAATQQLDTDTSIDSVEDDIATINHTSNITQEICHAALKIRNDLDEMPEHLDYWQGIDHVKTIIPESLFLFLSLIFGGTNIFNDEQDNEKKKKVCSIAQDIIYCASNSKKLTPKHIGLGLTLHQAI